MSGILILIPVALFLGSVGLFAFLWSLRSGQYEDLEGAAHRILTPDDNLYESPSEQNDTDSKSKSL